VPQTIDLDGGSARIVVGSLGGASSPIRAYTPLLGAEIVVRPRASIELPVDTTYEHGVLVDVGPVEFDGVRLARAELGYRAPGPPSRRLANPTGAAARVMLLGGEPFTEPVVMWWNFIGRNHDEIAAFRAEWEAEAARFGAVEGYAGDVVRLPAPKLPGVRLKPRTSLLAPPGPGDRSAWG
jgi:redox-sensitive bicupin YhaK (pirin superfamily)